MAICSIEPCYGYKYHQVLNIIGHHCWILSETMDSNERKREARVGSNKKYAMQGNFRRSYVLERPFPFLRFTLASHIYTEHKFYSPRTYQLASYFSSWNLASLMRSVATCQADISKWPHPLRDLPGRHAVFIWSATHYKTLTHVGSHLDPNTTTGSLMDSNVHQKQLNYLYLSFCYKNCKIIYN